MKLRAVLKVVFTGGGASRVEVVVLPGFSRRRPSVLQVKLVTNRACAAMMNTVSESVRISTF